jgi:hypothetical protein
MSEKDWKKIARILKEIYKQLEAEALSKGMDIFSDEYKPYIEGTNTIFSDEVNDTPQLNSDNSIIKRGFEKNLDKITKLTILQIRFFDQQVEKSKDSYLMKEKLEGRLLFLDTNKQVLS